METKDRLAMVLAIAALVVGLSVVWASPIEDAYAPISVEPYNPLDNHP